MSAAPVIAGTGVAVAEDSLVLWRALVALVVALALQVGVNYANDYSDGIRGTDADRVGPLRLVGSGAASPKAVLAAALSCFGLAAVAGLALAAVTTWWLLVVGLLAIAAAWGYTGGSRPYGYRALGELSVFVFFGLVAVIGTAYVQVGHLALLQLSVAVPVGLLACALLVANNLRDLPGDAQVGKRTLAVLLGDKRTRLLYAGLVAIPFVVVLGLVARTPWALLGLLALPLAVLSARPVVGGATGRALIPTLRQTGILTVGYAVLVAVGLALAG